MKIHPPSCRVLKIMRLATLLSLLPLVAAAPSRRDGLAPLNEGTYEIIPDQYIVKFREGSSLAAVDDALETLGHAALARFHLVMEGFSAKMTADELNRMRQHPDVEYIDHDGIASIAVEPELGNGMELVTQTGATWGLTRISSKTPDAKDYKYDSSGGAGTCSYVLDTGIDLKHEDFENRAKLGKKLAGGVNGDKHGHGTHCAGTIGGKVYGVAKKTQLIDVKVLDDSGSGSLSNIIGGMEFAAGDNSDCPKGKFVNMSIQTSGAAQSLNDAATKLSKSDVFVGTAAGNSTKDAANSSPGSASDVCNVAASDNKDEIASFSNFGSKIKIFAPGVQIISAKPGGGTVSATRLIAFHIET